MNTILSGKNNKILAITAFYIATIFLVILFFTTTKSSPGKSGVNTIFTNKAQEQLLSENELLLDKLKLLQKLDEQYSSLFIQSEITPFMDSIDTEIAGQEYKFTNIIDSFDRRKPGDYNKGLYEKITAFYKQALESRRTIGNIRYALAAGNFDLNKGQKKWLKLNSDLIVKDNRISELENLLQSNNPSKDIADSNDENDVMKSQLKGQVQANADLTKENALLRGNIKSMNVELDKLRRTNMAAKTTDNEAKEKSAVSVNTTNELSAEIQLATINCNLIRADVKQIISNSKQRKELLSDALNVLNTLLKSDNPSIQNKAREKLNELNRISETVRD